LFAAPEQPLRGNLANLRLLTTVGYTTHETTNHKSQVVCPTKLAKHLTKILLMHGENDPVIPAQETRLAAERLRAAGFEVEAHLYQGLGHGMSREGVQTASKFLTRQLGHA
jgi:predicted esterase